jgi:hypothetical protein
LNELRRRVLRREVWGRVVRINLVRFLLCRFYRRKVYEFSGTVETRLLCEELKHAAEWIEDRYVFPCYVDLGGLRKRKKRRRRRRRERRLLLMEKSLF